MLNVFGAQVVDLKCQNIVNGVVDAAKPCIDSSCRSSATSARPSVLQHRRLRDQRPCDRVGAAAARPVAHDAAGGRPDNTDPNARIQRQMMLFLPLISIVYGGFLPAGLFIYWIVATIFSIIQQYLIVGWGAMFPIFGWTPAFADGPHPRFPVDMPPPPGPSKRAADPDRRRQEERPADKTIRRRERGRQSRRGRRR